MFSFSNIFYQNLTELQREEVKVLQAIWETFYQSSFVEFKVDSPFSSPIIFVRDKEEELVFYAQETLIKENKCFSIFWHPKVEKNLSSFFSQIISLYEGRLCFCISESFPFFIEESLKGLEFKEILKEEILVFSSKMKLVRDKEGFSFYEEDKAGVLFLEVFKNDSLVASFEYWDKEGFNFFFSLEEDIFISMREEEKVYTFSKSLSLLREKGFLRDISIILEKDLFLHNTLLNSGFKKTKELILWALN